MKNFINFLLLGLIALGMSFCSLKALEKAVIVDLALAGVSVQEKGPWIKFSNTDVWCRSAPEFSSHAQVCQQQEPAEE